MPDDEQGHGQDTGKEPGMEPGVEPGQEPGVAPPRRNWVRYALVAGAAMLVGALTATGTVLFLNRNDTPLNTYTINVFLAHEATTEQKAAVERALTGMRPVDGVHFETREQAYENFKKYFKDNPNLIDSVKPETLPESFWINTKGRAFPCSRLDPLRSQGGIDEVSVTQLPAKDRPGAKIGCAVEVP
jgi:cell division transport system permease protein